MACAVATIGLACGIAWSRAGLGEASAFAFRYATLMLPLIGSLYLASVLLADSTFLRKFAGTSLSLLILLFAQTNCKVGQQLGRGWADAKQEAQDGLLAGEPCCVYAARYPKITGPKQFQLYCDACCDMLRAAHVGRFWHLQPNSNISYSQELAESISDVNAIVAFNERLSAKSVADYLWALSPVRDAQIERDGASLKVLSTGTCASLLLPLSPEFAEHDLVLRMKITAPRAGWIKVFFLARGNTTYCEAKSICEPVERGPRSIYIRLSRLLLSDPLIIELSDLGECQVRSLEVVDLGKSCPSISLLTGAMRQEIFTKR
jgi:hypothetical protein